jgi:glutamate formiminotransferase
MKIIECVPNFSEGKNSAAIDAIVESIRKTEGVKLLNYESDEDYNRLVITFIGDENSVLAGALNASAAAAEIIDMRLHSGAHPRMGAIDVVPFIPVRDASIEDCINISKNYGEIVSQKLKVPVYLYEFSSTTQGRKHLSEIREGGYEKLEEKLTDNFWKPDFGSAVFNPKLGAIITGARPFLIAYNVNISSADIKYAKEIAENIREAGIAKRNINGKIIKENGVILRKPGSLKSIRAIGVKLARLNLSQVSINLTDYKTTSLAEVFEEVKKETDRFGIETAGSEVVGLVPLQAMVDAGKYYAEDTSEENILIETAINKLGLNAIRPFNKREKIIDYLI